MTPEDRQLILSLVSVPGRAAEGSKKELLDHFGASDGSTLGLELLLDASRRRDRIDVEMALIVANIFGVTPEYLSPLSLLVTADWHEKHEDVVSAIGGLHDPCTVSQLFEATQFIPDYLDYDESRALARKAIWALGSIPGRDAEKALIRLLGSDDEILREEAQGQLGRRNTQNSR
ncbi:HEAT repeat domain-containing protein [Actinoplanes sp. NPDC051861]|uniref:HEAT repeat domain-containing protein n=1 Tax=Actinoplanes sp. NPDC051861 TaxID=3155170 RepID=UPI003438D3F1